MPKPITDEGPSIDVSVIQSEICQLETNLSTCTGDDPVGDILGITAVLRQMLSQIRLMAVAIEDLQYLVSEDVAGNYPKSMRSELNTLRKRVDQWMTPVKEEHEVLEGLFED